MSCLDEGASMAFQAGQRAYLNGEIERLDRDEARVRVRCGLDEGSVGAR